MAKAREITAHYSSRLRSVVAGVVPMVCLLAETAVTNLTERDAAIVRALAELDRDRLRRMLMAPDFFKTSEMPVARADFDRLIEILDVWGLERTIEWVDEGCFPLRPERAYGRGIGGRRLNDLLFERLRRRADVLKAEAGISALEAAFEGDEPGDRAARASLRDDLDDLRISPSMHQLLELWALEQVTSGAVELPEGFQAELERLVAGRSIEDRLGSDPTASASSLRKAAAAGVSRWRQRSDRGDLAHQRVAEVAKTAYEILWEQVAEHRWSA